MFFHTCGCGSAWGESRRLWLSLRFLFSPFQYPGMLRENERKGLWELFLRRSQRRRRTGQTAPPPPTACCPEPRVRALFPSCGDGNSGIKVRLPCLIADVRITPIPLLDKICSAACYEVFTVLIRFFLKKHQTNISEFSFRGGPRLFV